MEAQALETTVRKEISKPIIKIKEGFGVSRCFCKWCGQRFTTKDMVLIYKLKSIRREHYHYDPANVNNCFNQYRKFLALV